MGGKSLFRQKPKIGDSRVISQLIELAYKYNADYGFYKLFYNMDWICSHICTHTTFVLCSGVLQNTCIHMFLNLASRLNKELFHFCRCISWWDTMSNSSMPSMYLIVIWASFNNCKFSKNKLPRYRISLFSKAPFWSNSKIWTLNISCAFCSRTQPCYGPFPIRTLICSNCFLCCKTSILLKKLSYSDMFIV